MIEIDPSQFHFTFARSSGPGGQNINKVNSKATLTWNLAESDSISEEVKKRFLAKFNRYMVGDEVIIQSQRFRSQSRNKQDCIDKLHEMLNTVRTPPKKRIATKPSKAAVNERIKQKKQRSEKKSLRREKF